jgi:hypothetical protein
MCLRFPFSTAKNLPHGQCDSVADDVNGVDTFVPIPGILPRNRMVAVLMRRFRLQLFLAFRKAVS